MFARLLLASVLASTSFAAASAAQPSITGYFAGTWACDSVRGSQGVKVYGLTSSGRVLFLANPFVSPGLQFGQYTQSYVQNDRGLTVTQSTGTTTFTASSTGWSGDTLTFVGSSVSGAKSTPQRETYRRSSANDFTQVFERAASAAGPWKITSESTYMLSPNLSATSLADRQRWLAAVKKIQWFIPANELLEAPPADRSTFASLFRGIAPLEAKPSRR